jgi:hypothetical protein
MNPLQIAVVIASLMGTVLSIYDNSVASDRKKSILILRARIKKFMYSRSRSNSKEFLEASAIADLIWQDTINFYKGEKTAVDVVSVCMVIYDLYEDVLSHYANINSKQMGAFCRGIEFEDLMTLELESKSYQMGYFILDKFEKYSGIGRVRLRVCG